jgi:hypothetical protein
VTPKNRVFKKFDKNILKYSCLKEQKILSKMSGRPAFHDVSLQSYTHQKNRKNMILAVF